MAWCVGALSCWNQIRKSIATIFFLFSGLVLVSDAISALGLKEGQHNIGQMKVEIRDGQAYIAETNTLCGSVASMIECVKFLIKATGKCYL